jgi:hypothetical protein
VLLDLSVLDGVALFNPLAGPGDNIENENVTAIGSYWRNENALGRLYNVVSDMESSARDWHSSRC